jgi:hypothetical protein
MAKFQRRFMVGAEYMAEGKALAKRRLEFVGRVTIDRREHLIFRPLKAAAKQKP